MPNPPDRFPIWVNCGVYNNPQDIANALGAAYESFYATYGVWPNAVITVGVTVFLGAYA